MSMYKTILLHCNDKRRIQTQLAPALFIAEQFEAHLVAVSVVPPPIVTGSPAGPAMVIDDHCKVYRADSIEMHAAFEEATRGRTLVPEWCDEDGGVHPVLDSVLRHARAADLVIASQTDPNWQGTYDLDLADLLALEAGRPVLIIPNVLAQPQRLGDKVLIAWNARREAARAVFDALPILMSATQVKVVAVNPQTEQEMAHELPTADICESLARHGVKCEGAEEVKPRREIGETLLTCAQEFGADLLVMGCYGHARWREFILGGATRHVLSHATLPVLMSH
jgi:nucleotide-binding universal stress UspA family protein